MRRKSKNVGLDIEKNLQDYAQNVLKQYREIIYQISYELLEGHLFNQT